jgi:hypothetical protein
MMHPVNIFPFIIHFLLEASQLMKETSAVRQKEKVDMHLCSGMKQKFWNNHITHVHDKQRMKGGLLCEATVWSGQSLPVVTSRSTYGQNSSTSPARGKSSVGRVILKDYKELDRLCGLAVRVPGCRSRGPGSIPGATRFTEKQWVWNGVHLVS